MQIMTMDGTAIMNSRMISSIYISQAIGFKDVAIRCNFIATGAKDMTLATYDTKEHAKQAMKMLYQGFRLDVDAFRMPDQEEIETNLHAAQAPRERAANGKKTVRRGGS